MAIVVPRSKMAEILNRKELQKYALYILLGESDEGEPKAYIGETNNFSKRIKDHEQKKGFWSKALVFISQNESQIDKADVLYLEAKAIALALHNKQYLLDENKQIQISLFFLNISETLMMSFLRTLYSLRHSSAVISSKSLNIRPINIKFLSFLPDVAPKQEAFTMTMA